MCKVYAKIRLFEDLDDALLYFTHLLYHLGATKMFEIF